VYFHRNCCKKAAIAPIKVQEKIAQMQDSITCTTLPPEIHKLYSDIVSLIEPGKKRPQAADIGVPDASLDYTDFFDIAMKKYLWLGMHGHGQKKKIYVSFSIQERTSQWKNLSSSCYFIQIRKC
jgi:hypothetical protein